MGHQAFERLLLELAERYRPSIELDRHCLSPFDRWSSQPVLSVESKQTVIDANIRLKDLLNGSYGTQTQGCLSKLDNLRNLRPDDAWADFSTNSITYFNIIEEITLSVQNECFFPNGLLCTLRRHQEWGVKYILYQERVLLGDEMGFGKTVQAIATMASLRDTSDDHFMVVCPTSILFMTGTALENKVNEVIAPIEIDHIKKKREAGGGAQ